MQAPDIPATVSDLTEPLPELNERQTRLNGSDGGSIEGVAQKLSGAAAGALGIGTLLPGSTTSGINTRRIF